jgi:hypothetical protein
VALKHTMKNKVERMRKEKDAANFEALSRHLFGGLRNTKRASSRIRRVLLESRTGRLSNKIQKSYLLSQTSHYCNTYFSFGMKLIMTAWPRREMASRYSCSSELNQHY